MNVARILYPVRVLGPGSRVGIWLCGCGRGCKGCSNPELWKQREEYEISTEHLFTLVSTIQKTNPIEGFTISGGEPMDQTEELDTLIRQLRTISEDILVYSGYKLEELQARNDPNTDSILGNIAVLVDGPYIDGLNDGSLLRGSSNQKIHILNDAFRSEYDVYLSETHNRIQNFTTEDGIVSVGIHHKGFSKAIGQEEEQWETI